MSEALKGKPSPMKGKTLSVEHRRKISEAQKGKKGHPHSAETRRKMSEALKGRTPWNRHPNQQSAYDFFLSLSSDIPLSAKRKLLFNKFPNVAKPTIYRWVREWVSNPYLKRR